jgi:hypothetical protein
MVAASTDDFSAFEFYSAGLDSMDRGDAKAAEAAFTRAGQTDPNLGAAEAALHDLRARTNSAFDELDAALKER